MDRHGISTVFPGKADVLPPFKGLANVTLTLSCRQFANQEATLGSVIGILHEEGRNIGAIDGGGGASLRRGYITRV
jgi:hypothetical protein